MEFAAFLLHKFKEKKSEINRGVYNKPRDRLL